MTPLLISYGQSIVDEYRKRQLVEEYLREHGEPIGSVTEAPTVHAQDDAEVVLDTEVTDSSSDISLDQSNNGFSLVNLHWGSFSTGLSSVLAVVLVGLAIATCCYFKGRRQRQTRSRHTELLHALSSTASHASSPVHPQSGAYPGSPPRPSSSADSGPINYPIARLAASPSASCGLPGCATTYERPSSVVLDATGAARFLPVGHEAIKAIAHVYTRPSAPFDHHGSRQTGITSLVG